MNIYEAKRTSYMNYPLVHAGDQLWFPFTRRYVVPVIVKNVNFIMQDATGTKSFSFSPRDNFGVRSVPGAEDFSFERFDPQLEDCVIVNQFLAVNAPVGHDVTLWTQDCDFNHGYDNVYLSLQDALQVIEPSNRKRRRAQSTLRWWRRDNVAFINWTRRRYPEYPKIELNWYPDKRVYFRKR